MKKGPQKHSTEVIQSAIAKYEGGARLSAIARELNVEKSTVKYWLDNANRFMPESTTSPITSRIQARLTKEAWDLIFMSLKEIKKKLPDANIRDLVALMGALFDRQAQFGKAFGSNVVPDKILERSEELQVTVRRYLQEKEAGRTTPPIESLGENAVQRIEDQETTEAVITPAEPEPEGNDGK
jgi:transposase-like protein